ncbi:unnamed protein product, partial [Arabidopsis halleri]
CVSLDLWLFSASWLGSGLLPRKWSTCTIWFYVRWSFYRSKDEVNLYHRCHCLYQRSDVIFVQRSLRDVLEKSQHFEFKVEDLDQTNN